MFIEQKCGSTWNFHKYRNYKIENREGIWVMILEIQEAPRKRWRRIEFIPRTILNTDVPEIIEYMVDYEGEEL